MTKPPSEKPTEGRNEQPGDQLADPLAGHPSDPSTDLPAGPPAELVQGTLDMLVLQTLVLEPLHGFGIIQRIEQISRGVFRVNAGTLFPSLRRLERAGSIRSAWRATENNRRARYYSLTRMGRAQLAAERREWGRQIAAIARILEST
jgi:PadR family transcriptional regulator PadR